VIVGNGLGFPLPTFAIQPLSADLDLYDAKDTWTRSFISAFVLVAEHAHMIPNDSFLWNLIFPKGKDGALIYSHSGTRRVYKSNVYSQIRCQIVS
jgi:hypothetical protein